MKNRTTTKAPTKLKKMGRVYAPILHDQDPEAWNYSHAFVPTPILIDADTIRVYCAFLDRHKMGRIAFIDLEADDPLKIRMISDKPCLDLGEPGCFDEHGVSATSVLQDGDEIFLYYLGWQRASEVPYRVFTGLSISTDGGTTFKRISKYPVLGPTITEPYLRSCGHVMKQDNLWDMWYLSATHWMNTEKGEERPWYEVRHLTSSNGVEWSKEGRTCISPADDDEFGFGRPHVRSKNGKLELWTSVRRKSIGYRFALAESKDNHNWKRNDQKYELNVSASGWDSEMICFPCPITIGSRTFVFYNGNRYGESGFGVAELVES